MRAPSTAATSMIAGAAVEMSMSGIDLRHPHYDVVLESRPALGFVAVHSENFFADGGAAFAVLDAARAPASVRFATHA